jgi:hypothetical protein
VLELPYLYSQFKYYLTKFSSLAHITRELKRGYKNIRRGGRGKEETRSTSSHVARTGGGGRTGEVAGWWDEVAGTG